jgi:hypothetical protein
MVNQLRVIYSLVTQQKKEVGQDLYYSKAVMAALEACRRNLKSEYQLGICLVDTYM